MEVRRALEGRRVAATPRVRRGYSVEVSLGERPRLRRGRSVETGARLRYRGPLDAAASLAETTLESSEIRLFAPTALPEDICWPTVTWALDRCFDAERGAVQQRTKKYDAASGTWSVDDDNPD